jgi:aminopeptidase N
MAHELAHHWFGNLITCESADDMWINEGLAEFSSHLYQEKVYSRARYLEVVRANAWAVLNSAHKQDGGVFRPLYALPHEYVYGFHTYQKGAMVGHNLRHYLGDNLFFSTLDSIFKKHAYENLSSASFLSELQIISGQAKIGDFGTDWIYNPGFSQFSVDEWSHNTTGQSVSFRLKQRLYEAPTLHNNVPVDVSFFGANGELVHHNFTHSGKFSQHNFNPGFAPVAVLASYSGGLLTATGVDHLKINTAGAQTGSYSSMVIDCYDYVDSGSVILMQHLVEAEKKASNGFDFKLGSKHYFSIQKIGLAQSRLKGEIRFRGSNGQLDEDLLQNGNDSLVLLFRARGTDQWNIYPYQLKKVGSSNSRIGSFELSQIENGDYAFANTGESLSIIGESQDRKFYSFYPNPNNGILNIRNTGNDPDVFVQVFNQQGALKIVKSFGEKENRDMQLDLSSLAAGQYILKINEHSFKLLKL